MFTDHWLLFYAMLSQRFGSHVYISIPIVICSGSSLPFTGSPCWRLRLLSGGMRSTQCPSNYPWSNAGSSLALSPLELSRMRWILGLYLSTRLHDGPLHGATDIPPIVAPSHAGYLCRPPTAGRGFPTSTRRCGHVALAGAVGRGGVAGVRSAEGQFIATPARSFAGGLPPSNNNNNWVSGT